MKAGLLSIFFCLSIYSTVLSQPGSLDANFDPGSINGIVFSTLILPDGKILVAGDFTLVQGFSRTNIARLYSNGEIDTSFYTTGIFTSQGASGSEIRCMILQNNGQILIGGTFSYTFQISTFYNIARLNSNGSIDTTYLSYGQPPSRAWGVFDISIQDDGKILTGSQGYPGFSWVELLRRYNYDGSIDTSFHFNSDAYTINSIALQSDGKILIGGAFSQIGGSTINNFARLNTDGWLDTTFQCGTSASTTIQKILVQNDEKILIAGWAEYYNGSFIGKLARLESNGVLDSTFHNEYGSNGAIYTLCLQDDNKILVGGTLRSYNSSDAFFFLRLNPDGSVDRCFDNGAGADNVVFSISIQNDKNILLSGYLTSYNNVRRDRIARINGGDDLISAPVLSQQGAFCSGSMFNVVFSSDQIYSSGNYFNVELSDLNGNFVNPTVIGSIASASPDTITSIIPASINPGTSYRIRIRSTNPVATSCVYENLLAIEQCNHTLNLKAFLQGPYKGGGVMNAILDPINLPYVCDSINILLAEKEFPFSIVASKLGTIDIYGQGTFQIENVPHGEYYIIVRHRSSLETWSATPVYLSANSTYYFNDAAIKAYGANLADLSDGNYALFSGDSNQDGVINLDDVFSSESKLGLMTTGYDVNDLNGDQIVESVDQSILENNYGIQVIRP